MQRPNVPVLDNGIHYLHKLTAWQLETPPRQNFQWYNPIKPILYPSAGRHVFFKCEVFGDKQYMLFYCVCRGQPKHLAFINKDSAGFHWVPNTVFGPVRKIIIWQLFLEISLAASGPDLIVLTVAASHRPNLHKQHRPASHHLSSDLAIWLDTGNKVVDIADCEVYGIVVPWAMDSYLAVLFFQFPLG